MNAESHREPRPLAITVICIIGFVGAPITMAIAFLSNSTNVPEWIAAYGFFSAAGRLISLLGLWAMQRWAVFAVTALALANLTVILSAAAHPHLLSFAWVAIELTVGWVYFRQMA